MKPKFKKLAKELVEMALYMLGVLLLAFLLNHFVGQHVLVDGSSMLNTLKDGDHLIVEKLSYRFGDPERFDIIVFRPYEDHKQTYYVKRIIGLPGETVQIVGSDIYINGEVLEEDYGREEIQFAGIAADPVILGADEYFVMGDNRNRSTDSRDEKVGKVDRNALVGKGWVRIWPLNSLELLTHQ